MKVKWLQIINFRKQGKVAFVDAMKTCKGVEELLHTFLTFFLDESDQLASRLGRFMPWERTPSFI
jgi:hypothetical protein